MNSDYADDLLLHPAQTKSLEWAEKTEFMCFNQDGDISSLNGSPQKLVDLFEYLGSNISSTESSINICIGKAWTAIDMLMAIWKSDHSEKIKQEFFQAVVVSILLYGSTT